MSDLTRLYDLSRTSRGRAELPFEQWVALERTGLLPEQIAWREQRDAEQTAEAEAQAADRERRRREFIEAVTGRRVRD